MGVGGDALKAHGDVDVDVDVVVGVPIPNNDAVTFVKAVVGGIRST
jgi:hypothetical protein